MVIYKYFLNGFGFLDICLVFLSVTSKSMKTASFISSKGALVGLTAVFITSIFTLINEVVTLFFSKIKK